MSDKSIIRRLQEAIYRIPAWIRLLVGVFFDVILIAAVWYSYFTGSITYEEAVVLLLGLIAFALEWRRRKTDEKEVWRVA